MRPLLTLLAVASLHVAAPAFAQTIAGRLLHTSGEPAERVQLVAVSLTGDAVLGRTLTGRRGEFRLAVREPRVRLRALRVGFRPAELGTIDTRDASAQALTLTLPGDATRLAPVSTIATQRCASVGAAATELATLFDDVRVALAAVRLAMGREDAPVTRAVLREAHTDLGGRPLAAVRYRRLAGRALRPFQSIDADSLRRVGYVSQAADGVVYHAPDSEVLASDGFLADHCVQFVPAHETEGRWVGIAFAPVAQRRGVVAIRGTFWLDRVTRAVRRLEFWYVGLPDGLDRHALGGSIDFGELPDGTWFESAWSLRMARTFVDLRFDRVRVEALQSIGGQVVDMRREHALLYLGNAELAERLAEVEAVGGDGWEEAAPPRDAGVRLCGEDANDETSGLYGMVLAQDRSRLGGVHVVASWRTPARMVGNEWRWDDLDVGNVTDRDGFFRLCGLPPDQLVDLVLTAPDGVEQRLAVRTPSAGREQRTEFTLDARDR
jgi:hypothetical protein